MKNIMLIAIVALTITTANAANWGGVSPLQVVNNTNVQLEFRTWPSGQYFTLQPSESAYETNAGDTQLFSGWGVDDTGAGTVVWKPVFDGNENDQGTMTKQTAYISKDITQGTAWDIVNVGFNDILTFTGLANSDGSMQLTATRQRGVGVTRGLDSEPSDFADVFCLDTNVEFQLQHGGSGRCPVNETQLVMVDSTTINDINDWNVELISSIEYNLCTYNVGCKKNSNLGVLLDGAYMNGFATIPYSASTISGNVVIFLPNASQ